MDFQTYIIYHTTKLRGPASIYKCKLTGFHFGWEDSEMHYNYLIRTNAINKL